MTSVGLGGAWAYLHAYVLPAHVLGGNVRIELDAPGLDHLRLALEDLNRRGLPHAGRNALNAAAFEARKEWQRQIAAAMILRNKWTERSIRVRKARGINLHTMEATVGSVADYTSRHSWRTPRGASGGPSL